jgi:hypothetical protein
MVFRSTDDFYRGLRDYMSGRKASTATKHFANRWPPMWVSQALQGQTAGLRTAELWLQRGGRGGMSELMISCER